VKGRRFAGLSAVIFVLGTSLSAFAAPIASAAHIRGAARHAGAPTSGAGGVRLMGNAKERMNSSSARTSLDSLPLSAREAVARGIAAQESQYAIIRGSGGDRGQSGQLAVRFSSRLVSFSGASGASGITLGLTAIGRAGSMRAIPTAPATSHLNRVTYQHPGTDEWYSTSRLGVEQGFVINRRPSGRGLLRLLVGRATRGVRLAANHRSLADGSIRYGQLSATDATGRTLPGEITLRHGVIGISIDDSLAHYPISVDPLVQLGKLSESIFPVIGYQTALSDDGSTLVTSGEHGLALVYDKPASGWASTTTPTAILSDGNGSNSAGSSVAISQDGSTIVVGGINDNQALVYSEPVGGWTNETQTATLSPPANLDADTFGSSVAISGSGSTIVVGDSDFSSNTSGSAYVFTEPQSGWADAEASVQLSASDPCGQFFGNSLSISQNAKIVAVGDPYSCHGGRIYVFDEPTSGWVSESQTAELSDTSGANVQELGTGVAMSSDGSTIVAPTAANLFTEPQSGWANASQSAILTPDVAGNNYVDFASFVTISGDGSTIAAQAELGIGNSELIFTRPVSGWTSESQTSAYSYDSPNGGTPALSTSGNLLFYGNAAGTSVLAFAEPQNGWGAQTSPLATLEWLEAATTPDEVGWSVAESADGTVIAAGAPGGDKVLVFTEPNAGWGDGGETSTLTGSDDYSQDIGLPLEGVGDTLSISADGSTIVASAPGFNWLYGYTGQVYIWTEPVGGWSDETQTGEIAGPYDSGESAAISGDGNTIVATAGGSPNTVTVYPKPVGGWSGDQTSDDTGAATLSESSGATNDNFGGSLAISYDGNTIAAGASGAAAGNGAVDVYTAPQGGWSACPNSGGTPDCTEAGVLTSSNPGGSDGVGASIGMSSDGTTVVSGAPGALSGEGAALVFTEPQSGWTGETQEGTLTASDSFAGEALGTSVAVSGDASTIAVGTTYGEGTAYLYDQPGGGWANATESSQLTQSDPSSDGFGQSVALDGAGDTIAVGAPSVSSGSGNVFVFGSPPPTGPITVTVNATGPYDSTPNISLSASDPSLAFDPYDGASSVKGTLTCSTTATAASALGNYPISNCSGLTSKDYTAVDYDYADSSYAVVPALPQLSWAQPADIQYGTALSSTQLDAHANIPGTFSYTPGAGTVLAVGQNQPLSATFTPSNGADYLTGAQVTTVINVAKMVPVLTWNTPAPIMYPSKLTATQLDASSNVAGSFSYNPARGTKLPVGTNTLTATFTPVSSSVVSGGKVQAQLQVKPYTPVLSWAQPASIVYGTALNGTQLDASADVPGTFSYSPDAGTVLGSGHGQTLTATFTPTDTTDDVSGGQVSTTINVDQYTPELSWNQPAEITYGTALSGTQLDATSDTAGTFAYNPPSGTVLDVGQSQPLTATFTPSDAVDNKSGGQVSTVITVLQSHPTLSWSTPASIVYGTALSGTQLDATASAAGSFAYNPASGTVLHAGTYQLSATFTPSDAIDYVSGGQISKSLTVTKATLTVTIANKSVNYGGTTPAFTSSYGGFVNGDDASSLTGTLTYTTNAVSNGSGLDTSNVGSYYIHASGISSSDYNISYANGTLTVNPVALTLTAANKTVVYGATMPSFNATGNGFVLGQGMSYLSTQPTCVTTATSSNGKDTSPPGGYDISCSGAAATNYSPINYVDGTLSVSQATPTLSWSTPASIVYGTALSGTQLDATASVAGSFAYNPAAGTVLHAGSGQTLSATFTPSDAIDYVSGGQISKSLTVTKATLTVTIANKSVNYGGTTPALTSSYGGFVNGDDASSLTGTLTLTTNAVSNGSGLDTSNVGSYYIHGSGISSSDYTISYANGTLTVNPDALTLTAVNQSVKVGGTMPTFTATGSGFVLGQGMSYLSTQPTCVTTATSSNGKDTSPPGTYPITCSGAAATNYAPISYVAGTLTVTS